MQKLDLSIQGMHCGSCALGIQMVTSTMDGVTGSTVSYDDKKGTFEFDESKVSKEKIVEQIGQLGYQAT
jgi:copper chaperone CopZ